MDVGKSTSQFTDLFEDHMMASSRSGQAKQEQ
jgi:hypothetical protein